MCLRGVPEGSAGWYALGRVDVFDSAVRHRVLVRVGECGIDVHVGWMGERKKRCG